MADHWKDAGVGEAGILRETEADMQCKLLESERNRSIATQLDEQDCRLLALFLLSRICRH